MSKAKRTELEQLEIVANETVPAIPVSEPAYLVPNIIDENNLLSSSSLIKNNITYATPAMLLTPLLNKMGGALEVRVKGDNELELSNNGVSYSAFQRFNAIARFPVDDEYTYEVGILVAYDLQIPKIKIYSGASINACLNLSVMGHDTLVKFDLSANNIEQTVEATLNNIAEKILKTREIINRLKAIPLSKENTENLVGRLTINNFATKSNFGTNQLTAGINLLADKDSKYYYNTPDFNAWKLVNAFTENIKKANVFDVADKSRDFFALAMAELN